MSAATPDTCFNENPGLLSVEAAIAALQEHAQPVQDRERLALGDATGRVTAVNLEAPLDVPGFDNSAMDGYALHTRDLDAARTDGLVIAQRIPAGRTGEPLARGSCARIFTGAPVPQGANAVAIQEVCRVENGRLFLERPLRERENIRTRGNDIRAGDRLIERGTLLRAAQLGLAASVGIASVEVVRRLRVAVFSTGDELVEPGEPLAPGQIYNSNRYQLRALLQAQGCTVTELGNVPDTLEATRQALLDGAARADLVMTSGGVSVGEEDHVRTALESVGRLELWRIRMKPGKPLAFGHIGSTPFIGLPGNPVSVFVTFLLFVRPYLQAMQGRKGRAPATYPVQADFAYRAKGRREYVRVRVDTGNDTPHATAFARQGSDVLSSVAWADGLVEVPENASIEAGDTVRFLPFTEWAR